MRLSLAQFLQLFPLLTPLELAQLQGAKPQGAKHLEIGDVDAEDGFDFNQSFILWQRGQFGQPASLDRRIVFDGRSLILSLQRLNHGRVLTDSCPTDVLLLSGSMAEKHGFFLPHPVWHDPLLEISCELVDDRGKGLHQDFQLLEIKLLGRPIHISPQVLNFASSWLRMFASLETQWRDAKTTQLIKHRLLRRILLDDPKADMRELAHGGPDALPRLQQAVVRKTESQRKNMAAAQVVSFRLSGDTA